MLDKAVAKLIKDFGAMSDRIDTLSKVRTIVHNGKDGVSPDIDVVVSKVVAQMPSPTPGRDGISPSVTDIVEIVLSKMPIPEPSRDGKDGVSPDIEDVATLAAAMIDVPVAKNGRDGKDGVSPDNEDVATLAAAMIDVPVAKNGRDGKDGKSVTAVEMIKNEIFVAIDGVMQSIGRLDLPKARSTPFTPPSGGSGMGSAKKLINESTYKKPVRVAASADIKASDGDVLIIVGTGNTPATVTYPKATPSRIGIRLRSIGSTVTTAAPIGDTVEVVTITDGQSVEHGPAIDEWVKL